METSPNSFSHSISTIHKTLIRKDEGFVYRVTSVTLHTGRRQTNNCETKQG